MGEKDESIFIIGSPDVDLMVSDGLPDIKDALAYYEIPFDRYAITLLHPVTTDPEQTKAMAVSVTDAMLESDDNFCSYLP